MCCDDILNIFGKLDSVYSEMYFCLSKSDSGLAVRYCIYAAVYIFLFRVVDFVDKGFKGFIQFLMRRNINTNFFQKSIWFWFTSRLYDSEVYTPVKGQVCWLMECSTWAWEDEGGFSSLP